MKLSTYGALAIVMCVVGLLVAHVLTRQTPTDGIIHILMGLLVLAAFMWDSNLVDGWIKAAIAAFPFGRRQE